MKVLVSDFDNTLFTEDYPANIKAINEFVKRGNMFIIATGRNLSQLKKDINGRNINYDYLICNDGGTIFDNKFNLLYRSDVDQVVVDDLINELKNDSNLKSVLVDDGFNYFEKRVDKNNAILARYIEAEAAQQKLDELIIKYSSINGYLSHNWINIVNDGVSKGNAIAYLVKHLNLNKQFVYTVGDNINDVSMNEMFNGYYIEDNSHKELIEVSVGPIKSVKDLVNKLII